MRKIVRFVFLVVVSWPAFFINTLYAATPAIIGVSATNIIGSGAQIVWTTDVAADSHIDYGTAASYYGSTSDSRCDAGGYLTSHCINLTGLAAATVYYYQVRSVNASGTVAVLGGFQFTSAAASSSSIMLTLGAPAGLSAAASGSNVSLSWGIVTNAGWYNVYRRTPPSSGSWLQAASNVTAASYADSGLAAGTSYEYHVNSCNSSGCSPDSNYASVTTNNVADTQPPSAPTGLSAIAASASQINLSWLASTDNVGVSGYKIYRDGSYIASVSGTAPFYYDYSVSAGATYSYYVKAYDTAGNESSQSASILTTVPSGTTVSSTTAASAASSTIAPNAPSNFSYSFSNVGATVNLSWQDNSTNENLFTIDRQSNGVWSAIGQAGANITSFSDSPPAGTYYYRVSACSLTLCSPGINLGPVNVGGATAGGGGTISVTGWGLVAAQDGTTTNGIAFGQDMDQSVFTPQNFFIVKAADPIDPAYGLPATIQKNSFYVNIVTSALVPGAQYVSVAKAGARSSSGATLGADFICRFSAISPGSYITSCPNSFAQTSTQISTAPVASSTSPVGTFLKGKVNDADQKPVQNVYVHVFTPDFTFNFSAVTDESGSYGMSLSAGTYFVEISPPSTRSELLKPMPQSFSIASGATLAINLQFGAISKTITGTAEFGSGQPITDAEIGAYSSATNQWTSAFTDGSGKFLLRVSGGTWLVGIRPRNPLTAQWSWTGSFPTAIFANDVTSEARTVNFVIAVSDAKLTVHTVDQDGAILSNAGVIVDAISASQKPSEGTGIFPLPVLRKSDAGGTASFVLKAGTYYLRAFLPPELGLFNPEEQTLAFASQETKDITLIFRKQTTLRTAVLKGETKLEDGTPTSAFVWAWSEKGEATQLRSGANGEFSFQATAGRWHIGAGKEANGIPYKSSEITIDVENEAAAVEIILSRLSQTPLALPVVVSEPPTRQIVAQAQDGAKVTVPDGAVQVATPTVKVEVKPTIVAPSQANAKVVSTVYDVSIQDASGIAVTSLQKDVEITIPYKDEDLKAQKITIDNLVPSFYDESAGTWVKVDDYTIDKNRKLVIIRVKHLTRFALVAAADITPPDAPANISEQKGVPGEVVISWINPASDFDHIKVYRSTTAGKLGKLVANNVFGTSVSDTDVKSGTKYFYVVRAVDPAGNESVNTDQIAVTAAGVFRADQSLGQARKQAILRKLTQGASGSDVMVMQAILAKEGVYPEGLITGFFGKLTKRAVIIFQEKYAEDILKPNGLDKGTGVVGPSTRAKLNRLQQNAR